MATKVIDILNILEEIAPSRIAEDWDNPGLQVGQVYGGIEKIFVSLDPTLNALMKAANRNAQLLLTHHPLLIQPVSQINPTIYPGNVIFEALRNGIAIVSAHTNLDMARGGINDMLGNLLGLQNMGVLRVEGAPLPDGLGLGRIGDLPDPVKLSDLIGMVKSALGAKKVKVLGEKNRKIRRVAVVGGSGGSMVSLAVQGGADLLLTGDVRHHEALEAISAGLALIDGGHFHTEKAALSLFVDHLKNIFLEQNLDVDLEVYREEKEPMRYE